MATGFELRLIEDCLKGGSRLVLRDGPVNRVIYVASGSMSVDGREVGCDEAVCVRGGAEITVGREGTSLWRYELAPSDVVSTMAESGASRHKLTATLSWPIATDVLMRADSVAFPPGGCAYLHTHQGPGIRCLIDGAIRIDTDGHTTSYAPGGAWFEAGPVPVFAQAAADRDSRFIRVMILPAELKGKSSISYVNDEDRDKPKSQSYKIFADEVIET